MVSMIGVPPLAVGFYAKLNGCIRGRASTSGFTCGIAIVLVVLFSVIGAYLLSAQSSSYMYFDDADDIARTSTQT